MDEQVTLVERLDLEAIAGIYVTHDPRRSGVLMWCGYCCTMLHVNSDHMGFQPFLSLMAKMAEAHRVTECPNPKGPFVSVWDPHHSPLWDRLCREAQGLQAEAERQMAEALASTDTGRTL